MQDTNYGMPTIEEQKAEARRWAQLFRDAGYEICRWWQSDDPEDPFGDEWQVWTPGGQGERVATFDIDGCGASWHGPDDLWLRVVGKSEGVTD